MTSANERGPVNLTDPELKEIADALWRIRDLSHAARTILGFAPGLDKLEGTPAHDGLWGIIASIERYVDAASGPIDRNL